MAEGAEMKGAAAAILAVILHTGIACSKIAHAAGPFDGEWKGATARIMHKCDSWDLAATIVDGKVNMTITSHTNKDSVSGRVEPDGTFSGGHGGPGGAGCPGGSTGTTGSTGSTGASGSTATGA
jgi:hypothetical protein